MEPHFKLDFYSEIESPCEKSPYFNEITLDSPCDYRIENSLIYEQTATTYNNACIKANKINEYAKFLLKNNGLIDQLHSKNKIPSDTRAAFYHQFEAVINELQAYRNERQRTGDELIDFVAKHPEYHFSVFNEQDEKTFLSIWYKFKHLYEEQERKHPFLNSKILKYQTQLNEITDCPKNEATKTLLITKIDALSKKLITHHDNIEKARADLTAFVKQHPLYSRRVENLLNMLYHGYFLDF